MEMKSQETNKIYKSSRKKPKEWGSNLRDEKFKEDKIKKTFHFKVIFINKTGSNLKRKKVQVLFFFCNGQCKNQGI